MEQREDVVLNATIRRLHGFGGSDTTFVSFYVSPDRGPADAARLIASEIEQAANVKSKQTRDGVTESLSAIASKMRENPPGENGAAYFAGPIGPNGSTKCTTVVPPAAVPNHYWCGKRFDLSPLDAAAEDTPAVGLIQISRSDATVGFYRGGKVDVAYQTNSRVHGKHAAGGQSQRRFERLIEEATAHHMTKVAEAASSEFLGSGVAAVFAGGVGQTPLEFIRGPAQDMDYRVVELLDPTPIHAEYPGAAGLEEMVSRLGDVSKLQPDPAAEAWEEFKQCLVDGPEPEYGPQAVIDALSNARADAVVLAAGDWDDQTVHAGECALCGAPNMFFGEFMCPCGARVSEGDLREASFLAGVSSLARKTNASVHEIKSGVGLAGVRSFGGIVATTRW